MTSDPIARYLAGHGARLGRRERLQAISTGQVLDMALRVYRQLGWTFLRLTVVPTLFCLAAVAFVADYVVPSLLYTRQPGNFGGQIGEAGIAIALGLLVGGPLFLLGLSFMSSIVIRLTSDWLTSGSQPSGGEALDSSAAVKSAWAAAPTLLMVSLRELFLSTSGILLALAVMGLGALIGQHTSEDSPVSGLIFVIGAFGLAGGAGVFLYILALHALAPAVAVLEGLRGKAASRRSTSLIKAQWGQPSGVEALLKASMIMIVAGLIEWSGFAFLISILDIGQHVEELVSGFALGGVVETAFGLIPWFLVVWTVLPVWAVCVTIVYYERRIRLEGYDIEVLAQEIGKGGRSSRFDV